MPKKQTSLHPAVKEKLVDALAHRIAQLVKIAGIVNTVIVEVLAEFVPEVEEEQRPQLIHLIGQPTLQLHEAQLPLQEVAQKMIFGIIAPPRTLIYTTCRMTGFLNTI
ncbi:hypothetical protein [Luteirhabdus pelagi]|uniref:hypothetical protein n=1 Tax=Luteirhabdus pelagi TaxID=2792783 RepID=UPI00193A8D7C|nr:hypothetical protein [Luteirhabdus pelagi]